MNDENIKKDGEVDRVTRVALFRYQLVQAVLAVDEAERAQMIRVRLLSDMPTKTDDRYVN